MTRQPSCMGVPENLRPQVFSVTSFPTGHHTEVVIRSYTCPRHVDIQREMRAVRSSSVARRPNQNQQEDFRIQRKVKLLAAVGVPKFTRIYNERDQVGPVYPGHHTGALFGREEYHYLCMSLVSLKELSTWSLQKQNQCTKGHCRITLGYVSKSPESFG